MTDPTAKINVPPTTRNIARGMQPLLQGLDEAITLLAGERVGFCLVVFTPERASYGSNCEREEIVKELKHLLTLWERGMPDIPADQVM